MDQIKDYIKKHNIKIPYNYKYFTINKSFLWACKIENIGLIKVHIENGADIHYKNDEAIRMACFDCNFNTVVFLKSIGGNIFALNNWCLWYCNYYFNTNNSTKHLKIGLWLLSYYSDKQIPNNVFSKFYEARKNNAINKLKNNLPMAYEEFVYKLWNPDNGVKVLEAALRFNNNKEYLVSI
jgi:hypothetical protein